MPSPFTTTAPPGRKPQTHWTPPAVPTAPAKRHPPTGEQEHIRDLYAGGGTLVVEAGAGTGKTSTLELLADANTRKQITYVVFNKAMATEARARFPRNVRCSTAHSLAWRAVVGHQGSPWATRLNAPRMKSAELAAHMGVDSGVTVTVGGHTKHLSPARLAGWIWRALDQYCQTADDQPAERHFPFLHGADLHDEVDNNLMLRASLLPMLRWAWEEAQHPDGRLPWPHSRYLKLWQLSRPCLRADVVMFDEAQDASPVMAAVVAEQARYGSQLVYVGDSNQAIYSFTGAENAIANVLATGSTVNRALLTQSWRFGPEVAALANVVLDSLDTDMRLVGSPHRDSVVFTGRELPLTEVDAVLTRGNAAALEVLLRAQTRGIRAHLVGGGAELAAFATAANELQRGRRVEHPDLTMFDSWSEVVGYVEDDELGGDLALMVKLVSRYGARRIIAVIDRMPREDTAELVISTDHKAKGREWDRVQIVGDHPTGYDADGLPVDLDDEERRLLYVAATRAREVLDVSAVPLLGGELGDR